MVCLPGALIRAAQGASTVCLPVRLLQANMVCLPGAHIRENVICFIPDALIRANMVVLPAWYTHWSIYEYMANIVYLVHLLQQIWSELPVMLYLLVVTHVELD